MVNLSICHLFYVWNNKQRERGTECENVLADFTKIVYNDTILNK